MDDKRYQVFVSSTYADLRDERQKVIRTLMEMDCIPAGMELFPAVDEEQWDFIKRVIDDCDYYIVIIGGRYGSTDLNGISYTEKEYDYAIDKRIKVLAFLHDRPTDIPVGKSDIDPELRSRLDTFRNRVATGRLVKMWHSPEELPGLVALSLNKTIKTYPAVGWVRANQIATPQILNELNDLRKRNQELEKAIPSAQHDEMPALPDLAGLEERFKTSGKVWSNLYKSFHLWQMELTWAELFALIAPYLLQPVSDHAMKSVMAGALFKRSHKGQEHGFESPHMEDQDFQTAKIQLMVLRLVDVQYAQTTKGDWTLFWNLTKKGKALLMQLRSVRTAKATS